MFRNALVSVSDKTGIEDFLRPMVAKGLRVVSTGGTAERLKAAGIPVVDVTEQTGFPEVMDGRVKTLHPRVHMALLARKENLTDMNLLKEQGLEPFDLVIVNLYPFEAALKKGVQGPELVEYIDVGGPSMLRAAAKNYNQTTVICDPKDYALVSEKRSLSLEERKLLAAKVFSHVAGYDALIARNLGEGLEFSEFASVGRVKQALRYGENPQQSAVWFSERGSRSGLHDAQILQGKELSYNNLLDLDAAASTIMEFPDSFACVSVKHNNPCGVAKRRTVAEAVAGALSADPVSVFGGIVALNGELDREGAESLSQIFLECVVAPDYSPDAMEVLSKKKNLRVLKWSALKRGAGKLKGIRVRSIMGGFLLQSSDEVDDAKSMAQWKYLGDRPDSEIAEDCLMAWKIVAHLKSNAIALVSHGQTVGLGMGQVNRVDAVEQAIQRYQKFHSASQNLVLSSDAFFPFADSLELAHKAGVRWVVQPGGSLRDEEVIEKAKQLKINMIFTGKRHFLH